MFLSVGVMFLDFLNRQSYFGDPAYSLRITRKTDLWLGFFPTDVSFEKNPFCQKKIARFLIISKGI